MTYKVLAAAATLLALAGCGAEEFEAGDGMDLSIWLTPLDSACSASAETAYSEVRVRIRTTTWTGP